MRGKAWYSNLSWQMGQNEELRYVRPLWLSLIHISSEMQKDHDAEFISLADPKEEKQEMTLEDQTCLEEYEAYLKALPEEREGERERLLLEFARGDMAVRERLSQLYLPYMIETARELYREGFFIGDLIQEGNMALLSVEMTDIPQEPVSYTHLVNAWGS